MDHRPPPDTHASEPVITSLDQVDLGGEVGRDFEADFLLANFRLGPGLHDVSSNKVALVFGRAARSACPVQKYLGNSSFESQSHFTNASQSFCDRPP